MSGAILVTDDEPALRDTVADVLAHNGYDVSLASDAREAMTALEQHDFDIVLADVRMPGMSGLDLLRLCKQLAPETEVVMLTGYSDVENTIECLRNGACDYLAKPLTSD